MYDWRSFAAPRNVGGDGRNISQHVVVAKVLKGASGEGAPGMRDFGQRPISGAEILSVHQAGKPDGPAFCMKYESQLLAVNIIEVAFLPENEMTQLQLKRVGTFEASVFAHHVRNSLPPSLVNGPFLPGQGPAVVRGLGAFGRGQAPPATAVFARKVPPRKPAPAASTKSMLSMEGKLEAGTSAGKYADAVQSERDTPEKVVRRRGLRSGVEAERALKAAEAAEAVMLETITSVETSVRGVLEQDARTAKWREWLPWDTDLALKSGFMEVPSVFCSGLCVETGDLLQLGVTPYKALEGKLFFAEALFEHDGGLVMLARLALRADEATELLVPGSGVAVAVACRSINDVLFLRDVDVGSVLQRKLGASPPEAPAILLPMVSARLWLSVSGSPFLALCAPLARVLVTRAVRLWLVYW